MRLRSHIGRPLDPSRVSNRIIVALVVLALLAGGTRWLIDGSAGLLWAPAHVFLVWALVRELDPDHEVTALAAGAIAGVWVLAGVDTAGLLAAAGLLMAARLVLNPVGLRPLTTDLVAMTVLASAISFTAAGWAAGFGIALAIYIDARMATEPRNAPLLASIAAAVGSSVVATAASALPRVLPEVNPVVVAAVGLMGLVMVVRDPVPITSTVDHDGRTPMRTERLHAARALTVVMLFVATVLLGQDAIGLGPLVIALGLTQVSDEIERLRRPSL